MAARSRRGAESSAETHKENGKGENPNRKTIEAIKDATGASEEDIMVMLLECNNDVNETTSRLIDNPFSQVTNKKQKKKQREEERKKDGSKVIEVRRQASAGQERRNRDRGPRGSLDRNGPDRNSNRGARAGSAKAAEDGSHNDEVGSAPVEEQKPAPLPEPTPAKPTYSRAPGPPQAAAAAPHPSRQPEIARPAGRKTMADLFKPPPAPTAPLPTPAAVHSVQEESFPQKETAPIPELADLSLGDPAVSAPLRISNSPAAGPSLQSNQVTQDVQVQGPSPRHAPISSALGIAPVVVPPPRYPSSENIGAAPVNAWGKPKPQPAASLGTSLLGTSQGMPGSRGLLTAPAPAAPAAAIPISNNNVLSVADPQVTSSGLLGSSAGTQLSGSYQQQQADLKSAERVILPQQVRDVTNLGLQFGNIGFDPSRKFGANAPAEDSSAQQHAGGQTVPERSNATTSSAVPPPAAVEAFNAGGLGGYQSGNAGYSTFSVQAPIVSQPNAAAAQNAAPTRLQESTTSQPANNFFSGAGYNNYQAPAVQQQPQAQQQPASYGLGGYQAAAQQAPSSQPAYSYQTSTVSTSQPAYGAQQQQQTGAYQGTTTAQNAQSSFSQYAQYGQQPQQQKQQQQQPVAQYDQQYDVPAASTSAPAAAPKPAVTSYDNSQYGNYNQQPALKEFQPAPKYNNASNAQSNAAHSAYNTHSHATGQTFGATAAGASTSAPLAAPAGAQQAPFAAPGMQQVPQYAAMGYGQYPYMNVAPHYGMQSAYFPQHPGGYGGYPAQASDYGAAANQPNVGFQAGGNYPHAQSSKYQGGSGYGGQYGGNQQRMRGKDKETYGQHASSSLYGHEGPQLHAAGPAGQYQGAGRDNQYSYAAPQAGNQGYGGYGAAAGQGYSGYGQYGYGGGQNTPNGQSSGFGKLN